MVTKWAGSIEIGVTTHAPSDLEFPSTMTNVSYNFMQGDYLNFHHLGEVRDLDDDRERCDAQWNNHCRWLWTESRQTEGGHKVYIYWDDALIEKRRNARNAQVGDRVAVVRKESGVLHFFVNSEDQVRINLIHPIDHILDSVFQGPAATNVPERIYGVIDLYGQAAQVMQWFSIH